jgi:hypothetical protein
MFDELERLRGTDALLHLLTHYAQVGGGDRETWQDRLMELPGSEPRELVRLHGELLAYGWVEQNTGVTPVLKRGVVGGCYRITSAGVRALKQARATRSVDEDSEAA